MSSPQVFLSVIHHPCTRNLNVLCLLVPFLVCGFSCGSFGCSVCLTVPPLTAVCMCFSQCVSLRVCVCVCAQVSAVATLRCRCKMLPPR